MHVQKSYLIAIVSAVLTLAGCKGGEESNNILLQNEQQRLEQLIESNKKYLMAEQKAIERYVQENNWQSTRFSNGAHYQILEKGTGKLKAKTGDVVVYATEMRLLNGQSVYEEDWSTKKSLMLDKQEGEIGLHEILKEFVAGDSVRFVLPSHLAFGVAGDLGDVGQRQPIVYHMKILNVQQVN